MSEADSTARIEERPLPKGFKDRTGLTSGKLTIIAFAGFRGRYAMWRCRCECGGEVIARGDQFAGGHISSCGCARRAADGWKHPLWRTWNGMLARCNNKADKAFSTYGGRGIKVCERWLTFKNFLADMGPKPSPSHSIDRKDNDGNYSPENCRWATDKEQSRNRRSTVLVEYNGKTQCVRTWEEELGFQHGTIQSRLRSGWAIEDAMTRPAKPKRRAYGKALTEQHGEVEE